ncbi:ABC-2 family transporter protein [Pseudomonadota bacterium]
MNITPTSFFIFILVTFFAFILTFSIETTIGHLAFWLDEVSSLLTLNDIAHYTFGGIIIPLFLYPPGFKLLAHILPFRYIIAFPLEIISNSIKPQQIIYGIFIQLAWITFFSFCSSLLWKKGIVKYSAFGG